MSPHDDVRLSDPPPGFFQQLPSESAHDLPPPFSPHVKDRGTSGSGEGITPPPCRSMCWLPAPLSDSGRRVASRVAMQGPAPLSSFPQPRAPHPAAFQTCHRFPDCPGSSLVRLGARPHLCQDSPISFFATRKVATYPPNAAQKSPSPERKLPVPLFRALSTGFPGLRCGLGVCSAAVGS